MARRRHQSWSGSRRGSRFFGAGTAVGTFLAFGMGPLAAAPAAHADIDDVLVDLFGQDLGDAFAGLGADWGDQDAWTVVLDPGSWTALFDGFGSQASWDSLLADLNLSGIGAADYGLPGSAAGGSFSWGRSTG